MSEQLNTQEENRDEFLQRKEAFQQELNQLLEKYHLAMTVKVDPSNLFAKIFKKLIKIQWSFIVINLPNEVKDYGVQEHSGVSSEPINNQ